MRESQSDVPLAFVPAPRPLVEVVGENTFFPARRIYCVGRNFLAHIREMGANEREPPFFFQKPTDSIVPSGSSLPYPSATHDLQHEIELVLAIGRSGRDIPVRQAATHVFGLAAGIDLTRRDLQVQARKASRPWESGKSFDHSAPIGPIRRFNGLTLPTSGAITLRVNEVVRQQGDLAELIWRLDEVISELSRLFSLEPGDLVFTGTPAGVGTVVPGDRIVGEVAGTEGITLTISPAT